MGDDVSAPNAATFTFTAQPQISEVLTERGPIIRYFPSVSSSRTFWHALIGDEVVAKIGHAYDPHPVASVEMLVADRPVDAERIFFRSVGQERLPEVPRKARRWFFF